MDLGPGISLKHMMSSFLGSCQLQLKISNVQKLLNIDSKHDSGCDNTMNMTVTFTNVKYFVWGAYCCLPLSIIVEIDFLAGLREMKASCISADHLQGQMNGAQYFTAVSSQRALRHVGISEADYAMQFIFRKPPIPLQTHTTCWD